MFIDTHTHLYSEEFNTDRTSIIEKAIANSVTKLYLPNIDSKSVDGMLQLEKEFPENCFAMMGLHPCSVKENYLEELIIVKKWLDKRKFIAICFLNAISCSAINVLSQYKSIPISPIAINFLLSSHFFTIINSSK